MSLIVEKVSKRFGSAIGLTDVSFITGPGEIVVILGPNGAGKTTLMRTVSGEWPTTSGYIRVDGGPVTAFRRSAIASSGDQRTVFTGFTGHDYRRVWDLLYPQFDHALFDRFAEQFKWDLSRRIDFAPMGVRSLFLTLGALACRPVLLLIDEPFQHITPQESDILCDILRTFADEHRSTVLLASTELYEPESLIDRFVVLKDGKLLYTARLDEAQRTHRVVPGTEDVSELLTIGPIIGEWLVFGDDPIGRVPTIREIVIGYLNGAAD